MAPDPRVCAQLPAEPVLPAGASVPAAVTPQERSALEAFLGWGRDLLDYARQLRARAEVAQGACPGPEPQDRATDGARAIRRTAVAHRRPSP